MRLRPFPVIAGIAVALVLASPWIAPAVMRRRADNPVWRGMRLADRMGCWGCHRAPHNLELANPGSPLETVPSFAGGNLMMYADDVGQVREWIRDGYTQKLRRDPQAWAAYRSQLIQMPAFGGRLAEDEIEALAAYVVAADGYFSPPDELARQGEELARRQCLSCHNAGGGGGIANPGSPFGYVPALWGPDFRDLVKSDEELREWITTGGSQRVSALPLATWFAGRQQVQMPAFGEHLEPAEIDSLVAYIYWLGATAGATRDLPVVEE